MNTCNTEQILAETGGDVYYADEFFNGAMEVVEKETAGLAPNEEFDRLLRHIEKVFYKEVALHRKRWELRKS